MILNLKDFRLPFATVKEELIKNWRMILLFFLILCGGICGAIFYRHSSDKTALLLNQVIENLESTPFKSLFLSISLVYILPLASVFLMSFSALGLPFIIISPLLCSGAVSVLLSHLYCIYKIDGVVFSLILIIPACVIYLIFLTIGCSESLQLSAIISANVFTVNKQGRGEMKGFLIRYLIILMIIIFTAAVQSGCISGFGGALLF